MVRLSKITCSSNYFRLSNLSLENNKSQLKRRSSFLAKHRWVRSSRLKCSQHPDLPTHLFYHKSRHWWGNLLLKRVLKNSDWYNIKWSSRFSDWRRLLPGWRKIKKIMTFILISLLREAKDLLYQTNNWN